jgi:hypothetical protein
LDEVSYRYIREKKDEEKGEEVAILAVKIADKPIPMICK